MASTETKPLTYTTEPVSDPVITQLTNQNICAPITTENYGVKFTYTDGGGNTGSKYNQLITGESQPVQTNIKSVKREWHMTLLPAMASKFASGWQVPNAMPGLNFRVKQDLVKKKLLSGGSIYQNLGSNEIEILMVGLFTGDGGIYRESEDGTNWGDPIASYEIQNVGNKFYGSRTINPMDNPPYNTGNRLIADQLGIPQKYGYKTADQFFKGSAPNLGREPDYLRDQFGETLFIRKDVGRRGMFDRVGCPAECELSYRPGLTGDLNNADKGIKYGETLTQNTLDFLPDYTYTLKELDSINDSYLEAVSFYSMAIKSARILDVEVNLRKMRDGLVPFIPKDAYGQNYLSPLRNGISNPTFKAVVKDMELYVSRSNRVWYTLTLQVVQADKGGCTEGMDSKPSTLKDGILEKIRQEAIDKAKAQEVLAAQIAADADPCKGCAKIRDSILAYLQNKVVTSIETSRVPILNIDILSDKEIVIIKSLLSIKTDPNSCRIVASINFKQSAIIGFRQEGLTALVRKAIKNAVKSYTTHKISIEKEEGRGTRGDTNILEYIAYIKIPTTDCLESNKSQYKGLSCSAALQQLSVEMNKAGINTKIEGSTLKYKWEPNNQATEQYLDQSLQAVSTSTLIGAANVDKGILNTTLMQINKKIGLIKSINNLSWAAFNPAVADLDELQGAFKYLDEVISKAGFKFPKTLGGAYTSWIDDVWKYFNRNYNLILSKRPTFGSLKYKVLPQESIDLIDDLIVRYGKYVARSTTVRSILKADLIKGLFAKYSIKIVTLLGKLFSGVTGGVVLDILLQLIFPQSTNAQIAPDQQLLAEFSKQTNCKLSFLPPDNQGFFQITITK